CFSALCCPCSVDVLLFFFFQAEDGIRDRNVTGVQTCALPICYDVLAVISCCYSSWQLTCTATTLRGQNCGCSVDKITHKKSEKRSEERRVGKECRSRWWTEQSRREEEKMSRRDWSGQVWCDER